MKKLLFSLFAAITLFSFVSCRSEITLTAQNDGSVQVSFEGECGEYFESMIRSFSDAENGPLFDVSGIKQSFYTDGFKNVDVKAPSSVGLKCDMISPDNTFLFSTGLVTADKTNLVVNLSPSVLKSFYKAADAEIVEILDLMLAPVFNDEDMSEEEYLETIGSFYGEDASKEIGECSIKLTIISADGKKRESRIPLAQILTLKKTMLL